MNDAAADRLRRLPCWSGPIQVEPLTGGLGSAAYLVTHGRQRSVARLGGDNPALGVVHALGLAAHAAAQAEGLAPTIRHAEENILVMDYIPGRTPASAELTAPDTLTRALDVLKRCHRGAATRYRGPVVARWPFLTIRDYGRRLAAAEAGAPMELTAWLDLADRLEPLAGAMQPTLIHADPTAGNWIDDGERLWLIDWEYAGFADPLVDLAAFAASCGDRLDHDRVMRAWAGAGAEADLRRRFAALLAAVALRDALWCRLASRQGMAATGLDALARQGFARFENACAGLGLDPSH